MERQTKTPIYEKLWFWIITIPVVLIVILSVAAITGNLEFVDEEEPQTEVIASEPEKEEEGEKEPEEEQTEFRINEPIEFENRIIEVTDVEYSEGDQYSSPSDGKEYVIVTVSIENNSDEEISYNPRRFRMQNSDGQIENETFTIIDSDTSLSSGDLAPGGSVTGTLVWEQPIDDDGLILIFEPSFWTDKRVTINLN